MKTRVNSLRDFDSLYELLDYFTSEGKSVDYLAKLRWNDEQECPYCGHDESYVINTSERGKRWKCTKCKKQYSVRVGTVFEESKLPLKKWFVAIYLITAHMKEISSHQLAKDIKVTQKTAWFVLQRVRENFNQSDEKFNEKIEVDETYIGGKEKNKHRSKRTANTQGRSTKTKTPVLGIIQRNKKVYAVPVTDIKGITILPVIHEKVEKGSTVYTDEWTPYRILAEDYQHDIVNHSAEEFVKGDVHTNNIESFWALLKRGITGI